MGKIIPGHTCHKQSKNAAMAARKKRGNTMEKIYDMLIIGGGPGSRLQLWWRGSWSWIGPGIFWQMRPPRPTFPGCLPWEM